MQTSCYNDYLLYVVEDVVTAMFGMYTASIPETHQHLLREALILELTKDIEDGACLDLRAHIFEVLLAISNNFNQRANDAQSKFKDLLKTTINTHAEYAKVSGEIEGMTVEGVLAKHIQTGCLSNPLVGALYAVSTVVGNNEFDAQLVYGDMLDEFDEYTQTYLDSLHI